MFITLLLLLSLTHSAVCQTTLYATWTPVTSPAPPNRCLSSLVSASGDAKLVLVGGLGPGGPMNDVWVGSVDESQSIAWQQQLYDNTTVQPSARYGHTAYLDDDGTVLLFGGVDGSNRYLDDLWSFDTSSAAWSAVRVASFERQATTAAPDLHTVQPSARALTHWRPFTLTFGALRSLPGELQTPNLVAFLNSTAATADASMLNTLLLLGGRSSPGDIYSTLWSNQPVPATHVTDTTPFNEDYSDLWLYVYDADMWVRVGNVTCVEEETVCADYTTVANLSALIPDLLMSLTFEATTPSRPAALLNRTIELLDTTAWLNELLNSVNQKLQSDPSLTQDDQNGCTTECLQKQELPSPTIYIPPAQCTGGNGITLSGGGASFCNVSTVGNVISQLRPNASEGAAMATQFMSNGTTYIWTFGGFGCSSGGIDIFSVPSWPAACFIQALSVLQPTSLVWYTFQPPTQVNSQYVNWPSARAFASMAIDRTSSLLWLYGGAGMSSGTWTYYNDLYAFDLNARAWLTTVITSTVPVPGMGASLVWLPATVNTSAGLYLYGGCSSNGYSNQLLLLQTSSTVAAYNWEATGNALAVAVAGVETSFLLTARAVLANGSFTNLTLAYAVGLASFFSITVSATDSSGNSFVEDSNIVPTELDNGVYAVNYTVDYGSTLSIAVAFIENDVAEPIPNSPFSLTLLPNVYSASRTVVSSSSYSLVEKGSQTAIVVQLRDEYNNDLISSPGPPPPSFSMWYHSGPVTDSASLPICKDAVQSLAGGYDQNGKNNTNSTLPGGSMQFYPLAVEAADDRDGTFTLQYVVPPVDAYYLYVLVDCEEIVDSPFTISALNSLVLPVGLQAAFLALACVVGSVVVGIMVVLVLYRNNRVVRAGSPFFLVLICVGVLLCIASVPVYAYPSSTNCRLFPFLLTTGYIVALSALCSKSYRVLLIFIKHQLNSVALGDSAMVVPVVILLVCETIINLVWLVVSPLDYNEYADSSSDVLTYQACGGPHATAFVSASVAFNGLIALWGVWLALQIRHVPEAFSESKLMGAALYNLALVMAITIPLTWTASNTQSSHEDLIIPGAAILWCSFVTVGLVVAPKLYYILYPPPQHFFDGYSGGGATMRGVKGDKRRDNNGSREGSDEDGPADAHAASPANVTISNPTWSSANVKLPSSSSAAKDDASRATSFQPSSKRSQSAGAAGSGSTFKSLDSSPLQLSPAMSSGVLDRQLSSGSTASLHQVQIDIQSPQPLPSPAHGAIRLRSHEQQHVGLTAVEDGLDSAADRKGASRFDAALQDSYSPPPVTRSISARSSQPPSLHNSYQEATRRSYATSPAVQYSQSYMSPPPVASPDLSLYPSNSPNAMRTSLSVDDLGYPPTRSTFRLPPGPQLTVSLSHSGSSAHRMAGNGVRVSIPTHRVSISSQQSSQLASTPGEQRTLASTPTALD